MRIFYQKKPEVKFYENGILSIAVRENHFEYVYKFRDDIYTVVNMVILDDEMIFFANLGDFCGEIIQLGPMLQLGEKEHPILQGVLYGENKDFGMGRISGRGKTYTGIETICKLTNAMTPEQAKVFSVTQATSMPAISKAIKLIDFTITFLTELTNTTHPLLKPLISHLPSY